MSQLGQLGIRAKPAAAAVGKLVHRGKQSCLFAELLRVILGVSVFLQQRHLIATQPCQTLRFVLCNADVLHGVGRQRFLILPDRVHFAVTLDIAFPTHRKGADHVFLRPACDLSHKNRGIGFLASKHTDRYAQFFKGGNRCLIDKRLMFRHFARGSVVKHDLTIYRFVQQFAML